MSLRKMRFPAQQPHPTGYSQHQNPCNVLGQKVFRSLKCTKNCWCCTAVVLVLNTSLVPVIETRFQFYLIKLFSPRRKKRARAKEIVHRIQVQQKIMKTNKNEFGIQAYVMYGLVHMILSVFVFTFLLKSSSNVHNIKSFSPLCQNKQKKMRTVRPPLCFLCAAVPSRHKLANSNSACLRSLLRGTRCVRFECIVWENL